MVGPLKGEVIRKKYLLVMVDKFTKWIDAKPVKTVESEPVIDFISPTALSLTMAEISQPMR